MKNFSFMAWHCIVLLILTTQSLPANPPSRPNSPPSKMEDTHLVVIFNPKPNVLPGTTPKSEPENLPAYPSAPRNAQAGNPSFADFEKNETLSEALAEFVSFQNQEHDGSPSVPGLDLFGTFWGNAKKYECQLLADNDKLLPSVPGLEIEDSRIPLKNNVHEYVFGTFWEDRAIKNSPVDCLAKGPGGALAKKYDATSITKSPSTALGATNPAIINIVQQQQPITGTITYAGMPLQGVTITVKNKNQATVSDQNGNFSITADSGDELIFSYLGFKTQSVTVANEATINISMVDDVNALQEVTINAGYYTIKEKQRTGSITTINAKDIEKQPVTNVLATLQGRMAGVNVTQTSGVPGGGFNIRIRGQNSLRPEGNSPLYIVDGMPFANEDLGSGLLTGAILPGAGANPINSLNPSDIESIAILKDADATAIYGARGANGVVLITTKKGKAGKTAFSVNAYTGVGKVTRRLKLLNTQQFLEMRREAFANDGITEYPFYANDINGNWEQNRYTDWQEELIGGTSLTRSIDAGVSGGSANTQFSIRGTNYNETTVFPGDFRYSKSALHFSINHLSDSKRFTATLSGSYTSDRNNLPGTDLTTDATYLAPNAPALYNDDGSLNFENSTFTNPLASQQEKYLAQANTLIAGGSLSYQLLTGLEARATIGFSDSRLAQSKKSPHTMYDPAYGLDSSISSLLLNNGAQQSYNIEPQLSYKHTLGKGELSLLAGATFLERTSNVLTLYASGFANNSLIGNASAATIRNVLSDNETEYRYNALFGRANYAYKDRYFLNLTARRDGSSRFGPGNRFANFGAVGAAWLFSKENAITKKMPWLSHGKLRASYGTTGSDQIGDYQFLDTYTTTGVNYQGISGLQPSRLFNPSFSWEATRKLEAALELGFFSDRLMLSAAHYRNRSSNQLVGIPLPGTTGFSSIQANLGATVENTGWEFEINTTNIRTAKLRWTTAINLTLAKNRLVDFPNLEGSTYASQYRIGQPLGILLIYHYTGTDPQTGLHTFTDFNGDGLLTPEADRQKVIDPTPELFGGLQNSITVGNWQLDFLFQFVKQIAPNYAARTVLPGAGTNMPVEVLQRWQQPGDITTTQRFSAGFDAAAYESYARYSYSDAAYSDGSYARLKNLSLSYTLPKEWTAKTSCRLYFQAQNLLTITGYRGMDPETLSGGRLPPLRILSIGTQINF